VHATYTKGLIDLAKEYMALKQWDTDSVKIATNYLEFLKLRARGQIPTGARV